MPLLSLAVRFRRRAKIHTYPTPTNARICSKTGRQIRACGPSRMYAGTHPRSSARGPSSRSVVRRISSRAESIAQSPLAHGCACTHMRLNGNPCGDGITPQIRHNHRWSKSQPSSFQNVRLMIMTMAAAAAVAAAAANDDRPAGQPTTDNRRMTTSQPTDRPTD